TLERLCLAAILLGVGLFAPGLGRLVYPYSPAAVHALCLSLGAFLLLRRGVQPPDGSEARGWRGWTARPLPGLAPWRQPQAGLAAAMALAASALPRPRGERRWLVPCLAAFATVAACGVVFVLTSAPLESLRLDCHFWPLAPPPPSWNRLFAMIAGVGPGLPG